MTIKYGQEDINDLSNRMQDIMHTLNLLIDIGELSQSSGVSPSQIRYWEQKGYIQCQNNGKNTNHRYSYPNIVKVKLIKSFLDSGYTLSKAAEKASIIDATGNWFHQLASQRFKAIESFNGHAAIDMGPLADNPQKHIYFVNQNDQLQATIVDKNNQ